MKKIKQDIIDRLNGSNRVLITAHKNPDGDSLGSQLALAGYLKSHNISCAMIDEGEIPGKYQFLPNINLIQDIDKIIENESSSDDKFDTAVVIECSNLERIGRVGKLIGDDCHIINIDHHQDNTPFGSINWKDPSVSAAGELIFDLIRCASAPIDSDMATNLYTAILTDTGRFHFSNTNARCLRVAADLIELGADPERITEEVYFNQSRPSLRITGLALSGMQYLNDGRICLISVDRNMIREAEVANGDMEGLVNNTLKAKGVIVGAMFTEIDASTTKVSLRSQGDFDVAEIAAIYNGGGHANASGCQIAQPLVQAREVMIKLFKERLDGSV
ncbi:MAG: bifunctional oligoribonuclease/PAP phosphatase NrnA [FCB group bacterium]|nr:bifunctional oligoribonuclease/PAP phosphatase NrnA [FCB group bacterium]